SSLPINGELQQPAPFAVLPAQPARLPTSCGCGEESRLQVLSLLLKLPSHLIDRRPGHAADLPEAPQCRPERHPAPNPPANHRLTSLQAVVAGGRKKAREVLRGPGRRRSGPPRQSPGISPLLV